MSNQADDATKSGAGQQGQHGREGIARRPRPRSPLVVGAVAYGLLLWMVLVVFMLIAWRLSGG